MSDGDFAQAASVLEQLARAADARGGPRAPMFYIQAGRARGLAGQAAEALESMERGLGLLAVSGQSRRLIRIGNRLVAELSQRGLAKESQQLAEYLRNLAPSMVAHVPFSAPVERPPLPTQCPGCGAPTRPDEVEWLDETTAECAYCGTVLRKG